MTLYIAVDGTDPEALDAADDELIAETVHQLLHDELLIQKIKTVGIVADLEDEIDKAVISERSLRVLADEAADPLSPNELPGHLDVIDEAVNEANVALHGNGDDDD